MKIRSFLAFRLPPAIKSGIEQISRDIRDSDLNISLVKTDNIHLTLLFLGDVDEDDIPSIKEAFNDSCSVYAPFKVYLKGVGVFPNLRRPRVLWLGLEGEIERLSFLKSDLEERLEPFGIKKEKRGFKAHLTLGRFRKSVPGYLLRDVLKKYGNFISEEWLLDELILFRSILKNTGAEYRIIQSCAMTGHD